MNEKWQQFIDDVINTCSPAEYLRFIRESGDREAADSGELTQAYHTVPLILLTSGMFAQAISLPDSDLSSISEGLDRLWQATIDERDTSALSARDQEKDSDWLESLEALHEEANGMLTVLEAYVTGETASDNVDRLIQQSLLLAASNLPQARQHFARAGAAILRGASYWPFWNSEIDTPPITHWVSGLFSLVAFLKVNGWFPLAAIAEERPRLAQTIAPDKLRFGPEVLEGEDADEEKLSPAEQQLMAILLCGSEQLTAEQIAAAPPFTPEILERLEDVLLNPEYAFDESPGRGYAPIHAARLLGKSGSPQAVEPLLDALYDSEPEEIIWSAAIFALEELGALALPLVLESMRYSTDPDFKLGLAGVLGKIGRGDERAFRALEAYYYETTWADDRLPAVSDLADLGDVRALPLLRKALNEREIGPMGIREVAGAIEAIDPNHDPAELQRLADKAQQRYDSQHVRFDNRGQAFCRDCGSLMSKNMLGEWQHVEPEQAPARTSHPASFSPAPELGLPAVDPRFLKAGRNDPCPCGSGKKFKHCHGAAKPTVH